MKSRKQWEEPGIGEATGDKFDVDCEVRELLGSLII